MAWLIIKIEPHEDRCLSQRDPKRQGYVDVWASRHALREPQQKRIREVMLKRGWEMGGGEGMPRPTTTDDFPFQAYIYVSKRQDGVGRSGSSLFRRLVRRKN